MERFFIGIKNVNTVFLKKREENWWIASTKWISILDNNFKIGSYFNTAVKIERDIS